MILATGMKHYFWLLAALYLLLPVSSCNNNESDKDLAVKKVAAAKKVIERAKENKFHISSRNFTITPENAYNDLFLDSADLVKFIRENKIPEDTALRMTNFYNARNYEYAWFSSEGFSEPAFGFISLLDIQPDTSAEEKKLLKRLNALKTETDIQPGKNSEHFPALELLLTWNLVEYMLDKFDNEAIVQPTIERLVPAMKMKPLVYADSVLRRSKRGDHFSEKNVPYQLLMFQLGQYVNLARSNKWNRIPDPGKTLKQGMTDTAVSPIKNNLYLLGDMRKKDTSAFYGDVLLAAVKNFQARHGMHQDGIISDELIALMNITPLEHVKKILINMNRMRWMPSSPPGKLIMVNIPAFKLNTYEENEFLFSMPVIVGDQGHHTVLFADKVTHIVFSPYWNIPQSIVKNEILPAMRSTWNYLGEHHMEITGERNGYPVIRQLPGPWNSLGQVKFFFFNSFSIYLHDTPAEYLFNKEDRAYSHGCIRVAAPVHLAQWLLEKEKWDSEKISSAMQQSYPQWVALKHPASIIITYYTAWVNDNGRIEFREDIYGHDKAEAEKLFL